jgi:putative transcriptional regulator
MTGSICPSLYGDYAAGTLDEGLALVVASYLCYCPEARAHVGNCAKMAGAMLESLTDPVGMKDNSLQNVLLRLDEEEKCAAAADIALADGVMLPKPLCALLCAHGRGLKWRRMGRRSRYAHLPRTNGGTRITVFDIAPGRRLPGHRHRGTELTLILRGAYSDERGHYTEGTLAVTGADAQHSPVADAQRGCLCITATQGLYFTGPLGRLMDILWG